jgi:hypothetical protein
VPTFDDYELHPFRSRPIELFTFVAPTATWRITTHDKDIAFGGNTFTSETSSRSNLRILDAQSDQYDVSVELLATHPLIVHYANGFPPREVTCLIQRYQPDSGIAIQMHYGYVLALGFKGRMGSLRIPSAIADSLQLECPSVLAQRTCQHILFDSRCRKLKVDYQVPTTVTAISIDGRVITTAASTPAAITDYTGNRVDWALHGHLVHATSTEPRTIIEQIALNEFRLQCEFGGGANVQIGDVVTVYAGCLQTPGQCRDKFSNMDNYGGHPDLPESNIFRNNVTSIRYQ